MTTPRTDIHRESALDPDAYQYLSDICPAPPAPAFDGAGFHEWVEEMRAWRANRSAQLDLLHERGTDIHPGIESCDHCGAWYKWGILVEHHGTGEVLSVGHTCASERFDCTTLEFKRKRAAKLRATARSRRGLWSKMRMFAEANKAEVSALNRFRRIDSFLNSLRNQLRRNGKLSERQIECVLPAAEKAAARAQERAKIDNALPPVAPAPITDQRIQVTGIVLGVRTQETDFGEVQKMIVHSDDGFKVWSTVPASIHMALDGESLRGQRVTFKCRLDVSDRDPTFSFAKRPTAAHLLKGD